MKMLLRIRRDVAFMLLKTEYHRFWALTKENGNFHAQQSMRRRIFSLRQLAARHLTGRYAGQRSGYARRAEVAHIEVELRLTPFTLCLFFQTGASYDDSIPNLNSCEGAN